MNDYCAECSRVDECENPICCDLAYQKGKLDGIKEYVIEDIEAKVLNILGQRLKDIKDDKFDE